MSSPQDKAKQLAQRANCALGEVSGLACLMPKDAASLAQILQEARASDCQMIPVGGGTQLNWCRPEVFGDEESGFNPPTLMSLSNLSGLVEQIPGEGTMTAQAGTLWTSLAEAAHQANERMPADLGCAQHSTLGGVLASGRSGSDRMEHGPLRHHVLGMRVMLSDGTIAQTGGRLVKNVTGFDLHRLYAGSKGTLAIILEASLRLMPQLEQEWSFHAPVRDCAAGVTLAMELRQAMPRLTRLILIRSQAGLVLCGGLGGHEAQVKADAERVLTSLPQQSTTFDAEALSERAKTREAGTENRAAWEVTSPLRTLSAVLVDLERQLPSDTDLWIDCDAGRALVAKNPDTVTAGLPPWAGSVIALGGRLRPLCVHAQAHGLTAPMDSPVQLRSWATQIQNKFDPARIFSSPVFPSTSR